MYKRTLFLVLSALLLSACSFQISVGGSGPASPATPPVVASETQVSEQPTQTSNVTSPATLTPSTSPQTGELLYFWPASLPPDTKFNSTNSVFSDNGYAIEFDNFQIGAVTVLRAGTEADRYPYCDGQATPHQIRGLEGCASMGTGGGASIAWKENGVHYSVGGMGNSIDAAVQFAENLEIFDYSTWQEKFADAAHSSYTSSARTRIEFNTGTTSYETEPRELASQEYHEYILRGLAGQELMASIPPDTSPNAQDFAIVMAVSDELFLASESPQGNIWKGTLPATQDYVIRVTNWGSTAPYQLQISIPWEVDLSAGKTSTTLEGRLVAGLDGNIYLLKARASQTLTVTTTSPDNNACLTIAAQLIDGSYTPLVNAASHPTTTWTDILPTREDYSQKYYITVSRCPDTSLENTSYTLFINAAGE